MRAVAASEGKAVVIEIEKPKVSRGHVLVRTEYSGISPGTEMSFIRSSSERKTVIGYSAVGVIEQLGEGVAHLEIGQRVACYGAPYTCHAEWLSVPANLTAVVPDHVNPQEAAFAGLGAIAIHALRVTNLRFGESAIIVGLGTLGNLIAQIANAAAYRPVGLDTDSDRSAMLISQGLEYVYDNQASMVSQLAEATGPQGADAVLLCASGPGEALINQSLEWIRDRGKVVIVGDLTMEFSRSLMFSKEAQVLISRAGGPGRYDRQYEMENQDYPIGHVRWTEGRNIAEYIRLLAEGRISMKPLITHIYPLERAAEAYDGYRENKGAIATVLQYEKQCEA